jgi:hypothetical protein
MALFINREEQRTQLQEKVAADLKHKLTHSSIKAGETDPALLEDAHKTRPAGMVIIVLALLLVIVGVVVFVISGH